jgi:hypothetical protein
VRVLETPVDWYTGTLVQYPSSGGVCRGNPKPRGTDHCELVNKRVTHDRYRGIALVLYRHCTATLSYIHTSVHSCIHLYIQRVHYNFEIDKRNHLTPSLSSSWSTVMSKRKRVCPHPDIKCRDHTILIIKVLKHISSNGYHFSAANRVLPSATFVHSTILSSLV